jgi:hypothetical protein
MADVFLDSDVGIVQIRESINHAVQEICAVTGMHTQTYLLALQAGQYFYSMDWPRDSFGWVVECWDRDRRMRLSQTDLSEMAAVEPDFLENSGDPSRYFQVGFNIIGFDYAPTASGKVLELTCASIPRAYTVQQDVLRLRETYQRAAADYAASEFNASRGDATRAAEFYTRYLETANLHTLKPPSPEAVYRFGDRKGLRGTV